jgi:hypothetical protein
MRYHRAKKILGLIFFLAAQPTNAKVLPIPTAFGYLAPAKFTQMKSADPTLQIFRRSDESASLVLARLSDRRTEISNAQQASAFLHGLTENLKIEFLAQGNTTYKIATSVFFRVSPRNSRDPAGFVFEVTGVILTPSKTPMRFLERYYVLKNQIHHLAYRENTKMRSSLPNVYASLKEFWPAGS